VIEPDGNAGERQERPERRVVDVVVVGAGQAGLSLSYYLQNHGVRHVVLERDQPFASWVNRWDGFQTNTPNWMNTLPMLPSDRFPSDDPDAFATRDELLAYLQSCLDAVDPPMRAGCDVEAVVEVDAGRWLVDTHDVIYEANSVAICNGAMSNPRLPALASETVGLAPQLHSSEYRSPSQIETGNVLIVGSASSGVQICRLLAESGRFDRLSMAVSDVMTLPKRVLGVQTHRFLHAFGLFDVRSRSLLGRLMFSGLETRGDPIMRPNPKDLAKRFGVDLYGRFAGAEDGAILFADGRRLVADDLTIVWCTGFQGDYGFIDVRQPESVFDSSMSPIHSRGVVDAAPGLYFVGLRYQHTVASHDIYGVGEDARFVADHIEQRLEGSASRMDVGTRARS
jgi:putative flavoprotein involved in K+ transport